MGRIALHHPSFIEMSVLDGFMSGLALGIFALCFVKMITIAGVQSPIPPLDDAGIMKRARRIQFQVALPTPGFSFVFANLNRETVLSALGIVANEDPMAVAQRGDLRAGGRLWQLGASGRRPPLPETMILSRLPAC